MILRMHFINHIEKMWIRDRVDVLRLPSYGIYISQLHRFARCCTCILNFLSKICKLRLNCCHRYHKLRKRFGKLIIFFSELSSKFGALPFQECVAKEIPHPVFNGDLVYNLRRIRSSINFISSGTKIVIRLRRRQYDIMGTWDHQKEDRSCT